jgi:hypothetical protein
MTSGSKQLLLALFSTMVIVIFLGVPFHRNWFASKVIAPLKILQEQLVYMEPVERLAGRLGNSYMISLAVADNIRKRNEEKTAIILLPPKAYIKEQQADYPVPEPAVFYYYTGLKSKWINSPGVDSITHALICVGSEVKLLPLDSFQKKEVLNLYRTYKLQ